MGSSFEDLAGMTKSRRVSMVDVARVAEVSGQTVSRVVNGSPRVDPATRERVETAMQRLGYRPHRAARALRTGRTQTIGLIVSTLGTLGNSRMLQAVTDAAASRGYALAVVTLTGLHAVDDAFERLRDQGVDGAIVLNEATKFARDADVAAGIELVVVDSPADDRFGIVQTDHDAGARAATEHLLALGHETVWHVAGPVGSFAAAERERGWRKVLEAASRRIPDILRGDWSADSGFDAGQELPPEATAVFVANDQMALGVLRTLAVAGRAVPSDVSVVGFDDIDDARQYLPPLTTVRQDFDALGAHAVQMLVDEIENAQPVRRVVRTPALIIRESTQMLQQ